MATPLDRHGPSSERTRTVPLLRVAEAAVGGLAGGLAGAVVVVLVTIALKKSMELVARQATPVMLVVPVIGLALTALILHGLSLRDPQSRPHPYRTFAAGAIQADITGDVIATAGEEEHLQWRLAPLRALATWTTVGFGAGMGTEAPAAYFGAAAGAWLGDRSGWWRRFLRPAALGGGAAGVAALMGIPLVGTAYLLELGRQHGAPLSIDRITAALVGGFVGWGVDAVFKLSLIRLVVPHEPPDDLWHAAITALFIGTLSGVITALAGRAIYRAKKWRARPGVRLAVGGLGTLLVAVALVVIASPAAAIGPGGGAILWAESKHVPALTLLAVSLLRAGATIAATAAGGCGGIFVPFLAVGDIGGRVFAHGLGIGDDLSGAAGAAAGVSGGYRLPLTALAVVLGVGGPRLAILTCLVTVAVAFVAGSMALSLVARLPLFWSRLLTRRATHERHA